jgi:hypothetical protein
MPPPKPPPPKRSPHTAATSRRTESATTETIAAAKPPPPIHPRHRARLAESAPFAVAGRSRLRFAVAFCVPPWSMLFQPPLDECCCQPSPVFL